MRTQPNRRVENQSRVLDHLAVDITRALEHVAAETAEADGWPSSTSPGERVSGGGLAGSPIETDSNLNAFELRTRREDIRDWIDGLEGYVRSGRVVVDDTLRIRVSRARFVAADHGTRCAGTIDPTCDNWASDHRHPNGTTITELCDDCYIVACTACVKRPAVDRRVDGNRACEACWKRDYRDRTKGVTP